MSERCGRVCPQRASPSNSFRRPISRENHRAEKVQLAGAGLISCFVVKTRQRLQTRILGTWQHFRSRNPSIPSGSLGSRPFGGLTAVRIRFRGLVRREDARRENRAPKCRRNRTLRGRPTPLRGGNPKPDRTCRPEDRMEIDRLLAAGKLDKLVRLLFPRLGQQTGNQRQKKGTR
jgi:hypothetical protein